MPARPPQKVPQPSRHEILSCLQVLPAAPGREGSAFRFELRGLLPPWVLHRTLTALQDWHTGDVQVQPFFKPTLSCFTVY